MSITGVEKEKEMKETELFVSTSKWRPSLCSLAKMEQRGCHSNKVPGESLGSACSSETGHISLI